MMHIGTLVFLPGVVASIALFLPGNMGSGSTTKDGLQPCCVEHGVPSNLTGSDSEDLATVFNYETVLGGELGQCASARVSYDSVTLGLLVQN